MVKIQTTERDGELVPLVEGRLTRDFVPELEECWRTACAQRPGSSISVDLKNVICIDRAGRQLLRSIGSGVTFLRAGLAMQDALEEIMEQPKCLR